MRDPGRITPMLAMLAEVWRDNPDMRLGQLVSNLERKIDTFYVEDDMMFDRLRTVMEDGWTELPS